MVFSGGQRDGAGIMMDAGSQDPTTLRPAHEPDGDTVEIEFTAAERVRLSQAAESSQATARPAQTSGDSLESYICRRSARVDVVSTATFAVVILSVTAALVWRASLAPERAPQMPIRVATAAAVPTPPAPVPQPPLQVKNPFDATEVFEFPADMTKSEARQAMAELLLERARERLAQGVIFRHAGNRSGEPSPILVTKASATSDQP